MIKCCAFVLIIYLLILERCSGIILTNEERPKPSYTAGIKTANWRNPNAIQTHHNYSKVYIHNNPDGASEYVVTQTEKTRQVYPIYNAHNYGQRPEDPQRVIQINSQLGHNWMDHGSNVAGNAKNRTIYKRKIQYKTLEIYEKCPENATGQFVYYLGCNQFLNCWKGRGEPQNCAPGTLFNPRTLECDFPDKVECITGPRQNTFETRDKKTVTQALCPKEFSGLIPNYTDCSKFLICNNGHHNPMDCPPGTLFDINQNVCDFPYKSTCFSSQYSVYGNSSEFGGGQPQNLPFGQSGQNYHDQSGQYQSQKAYGLNQYGGQGPQAGGAYYQTTYGQNSHNQNCNPATQICKPNQQGYDHGQQFYQTQYGPAQESAVGYKSHNGHIYQTHYDSTVGGSRSPDQSTVNGQGQTYQKQDGQYYQTNYGSSAADGVGVGASSTHNQNINSKLDFGQGAGLLQSGCRGLNCGTRFVGGTQLSNSGRQNYGSTGCTLGTQNCGQSLGPNSYPQNTVTDQTSCNPRVQNCGGINENTQSTYSSHSSGQHCNPQIQNCGLTYGGAQQSVTAQGYGRSDDRRFEEFQPSGTTQVYGTGQDQVIRKPGNVQSTYNGYSSGQNCNPQIQNCGLTYGGTQQSGDRRFEGSLPSETGQVYSTGQGQVIGQPENTQSTYNSHLSGQNCNPQIQNCGLTYGGSQQLGTTQVYGSEQSQVVGQPNYKKVCNINNPNCHQNQDSGINHTNTRKTKEPKCPDNYQGITKHPTDCKKFLNCANGQTFIQDCAPGTLFNPTLGNCDFPYNVQCNSTEEANDTTESYNENDENWQATYYEHTKQYGQNAGHGNVRQETTARPNAQVTYHQGHGHHGQTGHNQDQSQGPHHGHGIYTQSQRPPGQGSGTSDYESGNFDQGHNINNNQGYNNYKPVTPIPNRGTNSLGQGNDYGQAIRDTNRGQIGVVTRPVNSQGHQNTKSKKNYQNLEQTIDYVDVFDPDEQKNYAFRSTTPRSLDKSWPPPFPSTDTNADYVFEYDDGEPVTLEPENVFYFDKKKKVVCGKGDFYCSAIMCISKTMVCDGHRDCQNGKDELGCQEYLERFTLKKNAQLDVLEKQRWINVSYTTCALLCIESTQFECRSFNYRKIDRTCFLSDANIGLSGALRLYYPCDYYELKSASIDCTNLYKCKNDKCITRAQVCDGFDDCGDRQDEKNCRPENFAYSIRLTGSNERNEGRVEVTAFGKTGYICDDQFGINDANVVCRELGFQLGAADIKGNSYYARDLKENNTLYMMDDLNCFGNETTLLNCGFAGWGVHNCRDQEIAGVVCKTPQEKCGKGYWKCDTGNECVPFSFVCDGLFDCTDDSDEGAQHCEAPTEMRLANGKTNKEGRIEIKHHGIWGTVCDDDFNEDAAKVVCKYFGFLGTSIVKKEGFYGAGEGPIWLDQVNCYGNETELQKCTHWDWGEHNCDHGEDVGVICSNEISVVPAQRHSKLNSSTLISATSCGFRKDNQFLENDLIHARVVSGSLARKGDYPWQAALRVKGKGKSAHWCGAVIISSRWVLTAAHCLEGYAKGAYIIVAGEYNTDEDEGTEQQKYIEDYFIHDKFRKGHKMNNDIALIKVKGNGFVLNEDVQPICLPDEDANYERELNCTISGFGSVKSGTSAYSHNLMAAWIPVHHADTCKMPHVYGTALTEGMICAGFLDGGVDACDGDSGGPLACLDDGLFTLYGLTSWGHHCGYANKPGVYVKVAHYRKWIDDVINKHS